MSNIYDDLSVVELLKAAETMCRVLVSVQRDDGNISKKDCAMLDAMIERFDEEYRNDVPDEFLAAPCYKEMEDEQTPT